MKIIDIDIKNLNIEANQNINLVLGFFDGVHIGHQQMIKKAVTNGDTGVMTFDISPSFILGKSIKYTHISSLYDKANVLKTLGVKYLYVLRMSKELLNLSKDEFIEKILKPISPKRIYIGEDYRFGRNAEGNHEDLEKVFNVNVYELVSINGNKVSSRVIRELISLGKMDEVKEYLGRPYQVTGLVVEGSHNGEKMGFPTANLELTYTYVLPKIGVYIGYAKLLDKKYKAIISMSTHPTIMELNDPIIEVHLLSFKGDLYGKEIEVEFVEYIRDVKKFSSLEELSEQLRKDSEYAKSKLV